MPFIAIAAPESDHPTIYGSVPVQGRLADLQGISPLRRDERMLTDLEAVRAVQAAIPVLRKLQLDVSLYTASVMKYDGEVHVGLMDRNADINHFGWPGRVPAIEVHLDPDDFKLRSFHYMK